MRVFPAPANQRIEVNHGYARKGLKLLQNAGLIASAVYGVLITLFLALYGQLEHRIGLIAYMVIFLHWLLLPSLVALTILLSIRRCRVWALFHIVPSIVLITHFVPFFVATPPPIPENAPTFTILTNNTWTSFYGVRPDLIPSIRAINADVVVLQEVNNGVHIEIERGLRDLYPYYDYLDVEVNDLMVLSRFPMTWSDQGSSPDGYQRVVIDVQGTPVVIYNTHLTSVRFAGMDVTPRVEQFRKLISAVSAETGAVVIAGDFNFSDWSRDYAELTAHTTDVFRESGHGFGFTAPDYSLQQRKRMRIIPPLSRVDFIFRNEFLVSTHARLSEHPTGSDHIPLFARLHLVR
jgi:endonuclease/exonuclease/phosphatase (EEP) superfamily protein YafD